MAIGAKGPRYSVGAFGFRSHMSICEDPPQRKNRIVDFASLRPCGTFAAAAGAVVPQDVPAKPMPEATRNERLESDVLIPLWGELMGMSLIQP